MPKRASRRPWRWSRTCKSEEFRLAVSEVRFNEMVKSKPPLLLLALFTALLPANAQDTERGSDKLVQYIQDARKAGVKLPEIRQKAVDAGWPAAAVEASLI